MLGLVINMIVLGTYDIYRTHLMSDVLKDMRFNKRMWNGSLHSDSSTLMFMANIVIFSW